MSAPFSPAGRRDRCEPHRPSLAAAALAIGAALQINNGFYHPAALACVGAGLVLTWAALLSPRALGRHVPDSTTATVAVLLCGVAGQLIALMLAPVGMYLARPMPAQIAGFVPGLLVAAIATGVAAVESRRWRAAAAVALVTVHLWLGALTYAASPRPWIDVVTVHEAAFESLAQGQSPYSLTFTDIYGGVSDFYPPGMTADGQVQFGFTYPPLSLAMAWPGDLFGDFRYAELVALALAGLCVAAAGRFSTVAVLASALMLFTPRVFFALEQAWTEPFAVLWLAAGLLLWVRGRTRAGLIALGLAAATKQYVAVAVPLVWLLRNQTAAWRQPLVAGVAAVAALLPGFLWDPAGFLRSVVLVQVRERLRHDSLSVAVTYAQATGAEIPQPAYVAIVAAALGLALWRAPRTAAGFSAALAAVLLTAFAIGKKAFCNYYFFVIAVLALAIAAAGAGDRPRRQAH